MATPQYPIRVAPKLKDAFLKVCREAHENPADIIRRAMKAHIAAARKPDSDEWYTPDEIVEAARKVLGQIDLDAASCETANVVVKATRFYGIAENGLLQPWEGRVWLNPPFSALGAWVSKAIDEYEAGRTKAAMLLLPERSHASWSHRLAKYQTRSLQKRIKFWRSDGRPAHAGSWQGHIVAYLGPNQQKFKEAFESK